MSSLSLSLSLLLALCLPLPAHATAGAFGARLVEAMQAHVASALGTAVEDIEVLSSGFVGEGCGDRILLSARPGEDFLGLVDLRVDALSGEVLCGQWRVRARLARWESLPVAKVSVAAGQPIELAVVRVRLEQSPGTPVSASEGPYLARTPLRAGSPVVIENSRPLPDVAAGSPVQVWVQVGALTIVSEGALAQEARVGERVSVRSSATQSLMEGTLIAHNRVIIASESER